MFKAFSLEGGPVLNSFAFLESVSNPYSEKKELKLYALVPCLNFTLLKYVKGSIYKSVVPSAFFYDLMIHNATFSFNDSVSVLAKDVFPINRSSSWSMFSASFLWHDVFLLKQFKIRNICFRRVCFLARTKNCYIT